MYASFSITESAEGAITGDVQAEAVSSYVRELFDYIACVSMEALRADVFIAGTYQNHIVLMEELDRVDDRVDGITVGSYPPIVLDDRVH